MAAIDAIKRWSEKTEKVDMTVVVGRFQTPYLHAGHRKLIKTALNKATNTCLIVVGVTGMNQTSKNPFTEDDIHEMISEFLLEQNLKINVRLLSGFKDVPFSDKLWTEKLDELIDDTKTAQPISESILVIGGRDSALSTYHGLGKYPTYEIESLPGVSATAIRTACNKSLNHNNFNGIPAKVAYRMGIATAHNEKLYPNIYPTVDVIIHRPNQILLGRKHGEEVWRLPGGFVDVSDKSLEHAALREALEECGDEPELEKPKYFMSLPVNDRRYKGVTDCVFTTVFTINSLWGDHQAGDDLEEVRWFDMNILRLAAKNGADYLLDGHLQILKAYVNR